MGKPSRPLPSGSGRTSAEAGRLRSPRTGDAPRSSAIELAHFAPYQLTLLADEIARHTTSVAKRHGGLNLSHWRVLAAIADRPGRSANEVVAVTPMDKGIVSRAVRSLLDERLVERRASPADGRVGHLHLTAKGKRRYEQIAREVRAFDEQLQARLGPTEREVFASLLTKLAAPVEARE